MNIYLISQDINTGYDTYDSAVVIAETEDDARLIHPGVVSCQCVDDGGDWDGTQGPWGIWSSAEGVAVKLIGTAVKGSKKGVVCASFNAG